MTAGEGGSGGRARPGRGWAPAPISAAAACGIVAAILFAMAVVLALMDRPLIGAPGVPVLVGRAGGPQGSQSLLDAYTLLHVISGMALRVAIRPRTRHWPRAWLVVVAAASGMVWEVVENSPGLIDQFGDSPGSPHYLGDSILNALGDILAAIAGFALAERFPIVTVAATALAADLLLMTAGLDGIVSAAMKLFTAD